MGAAQLRQVKVVLRAAAGVMFLIALSASLDAGQPFTSVPALAAAGVGLALLGLAFTAPKARKVKA
jgi:hypothetical protein